MGSSGREGELGCDTVEETEAHRLQKQISKPANENQPVTQLPAGKWEEPPEELGISTVLLGKTKAALVCCCHSCCDHTLLLALLANGKAHATPYKGNVKSVQRL